jgi:periplasmic protein TonB
MFEQSILTPGPVGHRFWSAGAGLAGEAALIAMAAVAPLVLPQTGPQFTRLTHIVFPVPPPPPAPAPPPSAQVRVPRTLAVRQFRDGILMAPVRTPPSAHILIDNPADFATTAGVAGGVNGGIEGGVPGGIMDTILTSVHSAPPPVAVLAKPTVLAPPVRVREGGLVHPAVLVNRVDPPFPPLASRMRISGTVELEGVIGTDGRIRELRVISGHPLLMNAAVDAVRQWLYRPTMLNGDPVEVITTISVHFRLN